MRNMDNDPTRSVPERMDDEEYSRDSEVMATAEEVALYCFRGKLREVQCVCKNVVEAVPTTIVEVLELARPDVDAMRKNATLSKRKHGQGDQTCGGPCH